MAMSLWFYGVIILGIVLGGVLLLVLFSLLTMAKKSDAYREHMASEMKKPCTCASHLVDSEKSEDLHVPAVSNLYHGGTT
jgi:hypothetical protein